MNKIKARARFGFRSDTLANWENENPVLLAGEFAVVTDNGNIKRVKIGDGEHSFSDLDWWYGPTGEKGDKGDQGIQGEQGDKGDKGDKGDFAKDYVQVVESGESLTVTRRLKSGLYLLKAGATISFVRRASETASDFTSIDAVNAFKVYSDTEVIITPWVTNPFGSTAFASDKRLVFISKGVHLYSGEIATASEIIADNVYEYEWSGNVEENAYTYIATFNKQKQETKSLELVKSITLEADVTDVKITFDKPLKEIIILFKCAFNRDVAGAPFLIRSNGGAWYMCYEEVNIKTNDMYFYAHSKEIAKRQWTTVISDNLVGSPLQGTAANTTNARMVLSQRITDISRYITELEIFIAGRPTEFKAGSTVQIWGVEAE